MRSDRYVLVLTSSNEQSAEPVLQCLKEFKQPMIRFDTDCFPRDNSLTMKMIGSETVFSLGEHSFVAEDIKSVWYRRPSKPHVAESLSGGYKQFAENESRATLWSLYTSLKSLWVNPPLEGTRLLEDNKLFQLQVAHEVGLVVPTTIITNNPQEALAFTEQHGGIVAMKPLFTSIFLQEGRVAPGFLYTNQVSAHQIKENLENIALCPVMFQEYIEKHLELRVTVIGSQVYTCAIHSQDSERAKHDWRRYDFKNVKHLPYQLPSVIEEKIIQMVRRMNLSYAAIDIIVTPQEEYVFLEVNPNGQWGWIEDITKMPISRAIAKFLADV